MQRPRSHKRSLICDYFPNTVEHGKPSRAVAGHLWDCTDIMPGWAFDQLYLPVEFTYAQAARKIVAG